MSDTSVHYYSTSSNDLSQLKSQLLQGRLPLPRPMRSSAPSRLQSFDDFYIKEVMTSPDFGKAGKSKTSSLTNLFRFDEVSQYHLAQTHNRHFPCNSTNCPCDIPGGMVVPSNSPTESDVSVASPLVGEHILGAFLSSGFKDTNNNGFPENESNALSIDSTGDHENDDEGFSCCSNDCESMSDTSILSPDLKSRRCDLAQLIRQDTFSLSALRLNESQLHSSENSEKAIIDEVCASESLVEVLEREIKDEELISVSSDSSDDSFVNYDNGKVEGVSKHAIYRSLSDSRVHQQQKTAREPLKRRKSVHFADSSGYELEIHIPISKVDDYNVPPRLMEALEKVRANVRSEDEVDVISHGNTSCNINTLQSHYSLVLNFQQPFLEPTFQKRVVQQNLCLESVSTLPNALSFTGVIRVVNLEFEKRVTVRYSNDNWRTFIDIPSNYVSSLPEFQQDQFSFHVVASEDIMLTGKFEMAICYQLPISKKEFWDNNYGRNYVISCLEHRGNQSDDEMMT